jgi:hypothetical protein
MKVFIYIILFILLISCDNKVEDSPSKVVQTKHFEVHHDDLDEVDLERLDIWFGEFCRYWESESICGTMSTPGRTRIIFDKCELLKAKPGWNTAAITNYRSADNPGADIFVCNLRKEIMRQEYAHAIIMELQRSFIGISPAIHEACAYGMMEMYGAKKRTWSEIKR